MFFGGFRISKNYAFDYMLLHKFREYKDGITFLNVELNLDLYKGHHNPQFTFAFYFFNFTIFEFTIYNIHHIEEEYYDGEYDYDT